MLRVRLVLKYSPRDSHSITLATWAGTVINMKKLAGSLADGGKIMTLEFTPNDDRVSPPPQALFALIMLAATPGGDAYTFAELKEMCEKAGLTRNENIPLSPMPQNLIVSSK